MRLCKQDVKEGFRGAILGANRVNDHEPSWTDLNSQTVGDLRGELV